MIKAKVVHIITMMELGGAQQNTLFTISHLNPEEFLPFLIIGRGGELFEEALMHARVFVAPDLIRAIRPLTDLRALAQLISLLKKIRREEPASAPVIVHTHSSKAGILGRWAAKLAGIPITIHSIHGFGFHDYQPFIVRRLFISIEKITARITTAFIAVSRANIEKGVALGLFDHGKTRLIRSGIDVTSLQKKQANGSTVRASLGIPPHVPVVTMIACLKPQKAPLDFIRACARIHQQSPGAHFLLVGDGKLRDAAVQEMRAQSLQSNLHILGWRRDIPEILHASNVFVLSSLWEGLPRVLPQAMAAGLPIVATQVDGSPEAVRDGANGFLVPPGDLRGLAEKVCYLLQHPDQASAMGLKGRELVRDFDIHDMVAEQEALYKNLLITRY